MKILPILQSKVSAPNNTRKSNNVSTPQELKYNYNLNCDTVSFGSSNDKIKRENSKKIFSLINKGEYGKADSLIDDLSPMEDTENWNWDPNYVGKSNGENKSLIKLATDLYKNADLDLLPEEIDTLAETIQAIANHNDFKIINKKTGDDALSAIIETQDVQLISELIEYGFFEKNKIIGDSLDLYINQAAVQGNTDIEYILKGLKASQEEIGYVYKIGSEDSLDDNDDDMKLAKELSLKNKLSKYELKPSANDPKSFDEIGGMFEAKKEIETFIIKPWEKKNRDRIIANNLNRPSGFLMSGPPGCGKTYLMKAISAQTGYPLYEINLSNVGSSYAYELQKNIKEVFDNLEELYKVTGKPSILMLDEIDSIAMSRKNSHADWKKDDINAILMALNNSAQKGIIVVGATNNIDDLDEAVKRPGRLDKHLKIGLPTKDETADIIEKILTGKEIANNLLSNKSEMSEKLKEKSPAIISAVLNGACLNAIYENKDYADMEDFNKMFDEITKNRSDKSERVHIKGFSLN